MTTTHTSGAADLPDALRLANLLESDGWPDAAAELRRLYTESEMRRAALLDEMQKAAQPAAQQGVAYAALPEFDSLDDDLIDAACSAGGLYRVDLMRAWNVLREARASHGQAPAQPETAATTAPTAQAAAHAGGEPVADGSFLLLPARPAPDAPGNSAGLNWDAYSGVQMLAFGRACSDAALAAASAAQEGK